MGRAVVLLWPKTIKISKEMLNIILSCYSLRFYLQALTEIVGPRSPDFWISIKLCTGKIKCETNRLSVLSWRHYDVIMRSWANFRTTTLRWRWNFTLGTGKIKGKTNRLSVLSWHHYDELFLEDRLLVGDGGTLNFARVRSKMRQIDWAFCCDDIMSYF